MQYQWADHQIFAAEEGAILFGVEQGSLFVIDEETRELLARPGSSGACDPDLAPPTEREILQGLRDIRILVPAGMPGGVAPLVFDPAEFPLTTLVLEVAQDCNLRCRYCYADGGSYGKTAQLLDPALARQAVRSLVQGAPDGEKLTLILFGGEPLLNLEAVRAALEEVAAQREASGKQVLVSLTTNGTLLTPEALALIRRHRVSVSVSMDGPAEVHDANRRSTGGEGSYASIVSRLPALLEAGGTVAARVTLAPEQWSRVEEVFDHLRGLGFHEVGIAPASPVTRGFLPEPRHEKELLQGFAALAGRFVQAAARGELLPFSNVIDLLARLHQGQTKAVACGAGYGYLALDAGGSYYLCHRLSGEDAFQVGTLGTGPDAGKIRSSLAQVTAGKDVFCGSCWARTLCRGGCHYENHLRENQLGLPQGSSCSFILAWLRLGIKTYAELRGNGCDALLQLLENRIKC